MKSKEVRKWAARASMFSKKRWETMRIVAIKDDAVTTMSDDEDVPADAAIAIVVLEERQAVTPE